MKLGVIAMALVVAGTAFGLGAMPGRAGDAGATSRAVAIEEAMAEHPPPVSVDFKNATYSEVADGLAKLLGAQFSGVWSTTNDDEPITFQASERPFWEVFTGLTRQGINLTVDMSGNLALQRSADRKGWSRVDLAGPVVILPSAIVSHRYAYLQNDKGSELQVETMDFNCGFIMDPRVRILKYAPPQFTELVDDTGHTLLKPADTPANLLDGNGRLFWSQNTNVALQAPEKRGTRATAKGVLRFIIQSREEHVDIAEPEKKVGQSFEVAGVRVGIGLLRITPGAGFGGNVVDINMGLGLAHAAPGAATTTMPATAAVATPEAWEQLTLEERMRQRRAAQAAGGAGRVTSGAAGPAVAAVPFPYIAATLLDAKGRVALGVTNSSLPGGRGDAGGSGLGFGGFPGAFGGGFYTPPFTLRITVATKTKEVTLPFELKDLPLP